VIAIVFNTIWNYFSTAQGYLDRPFNCFGKHLGNEYSFLFCAILFAWLFGLSYIVHSFKYDGSLYEVDDFGEEVHSMENIILPAVVLGIRPLAVVIQLMRNSLLETFGQDYIRTARAKGLSEFQIIRKHALKLLKPSRYCNFRMVASMLAGAVLLEWIREKK
jgi:peptide/nickel transport system permease protein